MPVQSDQANWTGLKIQKGLLRQALTDWKYYTLGIFSMFAGVQANLLQPILIQRIIDEIIINRDSSNLILYLSGIFGIAILAGIFNYSNRYFNDRGAEKTIFRMRNQAFEKLQNQSLRYFTEENSGQIMSKVTSDMEIIKGYLQRNFRLGLNSIYYFISIGIIIYFTQPSFLIVFFFLLPFLLIISWVYAKKTRPLFIQRRAYYGEISNFIQESTSSIETIRAFGQEEFEEQRFNEKNQEYLKLHIKTEIVRGLTLPIALLFVSFGSAAILYIGGMQIITQSNLSNSNVTIGQLVQFNLYMLLLTTPTRLLGNFIVGYTRTNVSGQRVLEIIYGETDIKEKGNPIVLDKIEGNVFFEDVSFGYDDDQLILKNVTINIRSGEKIAILGASGSGKTTLIQLLPRFFDPIKGRILIDKIDITTVSLNSLRKQIGIVSQDTFLFSKTIKENIAFGKSNATDEDIQRAAKAAKAHDFIKEFPEGYNTIVGERGITLSGGQQQRISIARTLLINPKILILDDSTSSVDAETESEIQEALKLLLENRTTIIITQKVSSLRHANMIYILEDGQIVESGTHKDLLELMGLYFQLYQTQEDQAIKNELTHIYGGTKN